MSALAKTCAGGRDGDQRAGAQTAHHQRDEARNVALRVCQHGDEASDALGEARLAQGDAGIAEDEVSIATRAAKAERRVEWVARFQRRQRQARERLQEDKVLYAALGPFDRAPQALAPARRAEAEHELKQPTDQRKARRDEGVDLVLGGEGWVFHAGQFMRV